MSCYHLLQYSQDLYAITVIAPILNKPNHRMTTIHPLTPEPESTSSPSLFFKFKPSNENRLLAPSPIALFRDLLLLLYEVRHRFLKDHHLQFRPPNIPTLFILVVFIPLIEVLST